MCVDTEILVSSQGNRIITGTLDCPEGASAGLTIGCPGEPDAIWKFPLSLLVNCGFGRQSTERGDVQVWLESNFVAMCLTGTHVSDSATIFSATLLIPIGAVNHYLSHQTGIAELN